MQSLWKNIEEMNNDCCLGVGGWGDKVAGGRGTYSFETYADKIKITRLLVLRITWIMEPKCIYTYQI